METIPDCNQLSWTLEELRLVDDAKLNLTNRFDFQEPYEEGGENEVLYVKNLFLGEGALLNTAFNHIYYETLNGDLNQVRNEPLLGFSLNNISMDDNVEFITRVEHNNNIDIKISKHMEFVVSSKLAFFIIFRLFK